MNLPKVNAPNIHLFAFHLRHESSIRSEPKILPGAENLWKKLGQILNKYGYDTPLDLLGYYAPKGDKAYDPKEEGPGYIVNLHKNGLIDFKGTLQVDEYPVNFTGIACPRRVYDSYALALNIRRPEKENERQTDAVPISIYGQFNTHANLLLPDFIQSSLGQTLLLTADLTDEQKQFSPEGLKNLACQCVDELIEDPKKRPSYSNKGRLFGSPIFEFGDIDSLESQSDYRHILVLFFRDDTLKRKFESAYWDLIELFYYRNKILTCFDFTRSGYQETYRKYEEIEAIISEVNEQIGNLVPNKRLGYKYLESLKQKLKIMPGLALEYSRLQQVLERNRNTIAIDAKKYDASLDEIQRKQNLDVFYLKPIDLSFVENFTRQEVPYFQERIKADLDYFVHGKGLVDRAIATIRGIVEIERIDRERHLETKLEAIAVGVGTAAVVAASSIYLSLDQPITSLNPPDRSPSIALFMMVILISIAVGTIVFALFSWLLSWIRRD
ncbi:hypothetical protein NG791_03595 [Laspinema sp. D1]|uniref:hypothetical protein n=1 Tax=Laspinema palackyanum TaxID=3231601 RepID=UPI0034866438|nr:hypothetical protein [Laspinema sp. D2b]